MNILMRVYKHLVMAITDPWTYYFLFWFVVCGIIYKTGDKWRR